MVSQANDVGPWFDAAKVHGLGTGEESKFDLEDSANLEAQAEAAGVDLAELFIDRMIAREGRELFNVWMFGGNMDAAFKYQALEHVVPLLGDAGAHVGQICDADSTTFLLTEHGTHTGTRPGEVIREFIRG